jgi:hypothetical protein
MAEFEEVASTPFGKFVVTGQPTSVDDFVIVGQYDTEGEANTVAAAKVTDPDNFYRTRVHPPNGNGYQDVEQN